MRRFWIFLAALVALSASFAAAQSAGYKPPHRPDGAPDLQGIWGDQLMITPLERPGEFKTVAISDAEAAKYEHMFEDYEAFEKKLKETRPNIPTVGDSEHQWLGGAKLHLARIGGQARSSILIDPANGQLPLKPEASARLRARRRQGARNFDDPEVRPDEERCLAAPGPLLAEGEIRIIQTPDHVAIDVETAQGPRIIRLKDRRHAPAPVTRWMGDSVGWFEDDTLVIETTGLDPHANSVRPPLSSTAKIVERFSRTGPDELLYRFTVDDPANYTHTWSGVFALKAVSGRMLTYECHEGNYALGNILAGARRVERDGGTPEPLDGGDPPPKSADAGVKSASSAPTPTAPQPAGATTKSTDAAP